MYTGVHTVHGAQLQHWVGNKHTGYETNKCMTLNTQVGCQFCCSSQARCVACCSLRTCELTFSFPRWYEMPAEYCLLKSKPCSTRNLRAPGSTMQSSEHSNITLNVWTLNDHCLICTSAPELASAGDASLLMQVCPTLCSLKHERPRDSTDLVLATSHRFLYRSGSDLENKVMNQKNIQHQTTLHKLYKVRYCFATQ